jgi:hypothetical protein
VQDVRRFAKGRYLSRAGSEFREVTMAKTFAYCAGLSALVLLATLTDGMSSPVVRLPTPKVTVLHPRVSVPQQQSIWGINQNIQYDRDRWQWQQQKAPKNTGTTK